MARPIGSVGILLASLSLVFIAPPFLFAELKPDQLAILVNQNSSDSWAVARHYATQREVPLGHIIALDLPLQESLTRVQYETIVVPGLRQALQERGLATQVRAVITTYGVPMRILAAEPTEQHRAWHKDAHARYQVAHRRLESMEQWIRGLEMAHASPMPVTSRTARREVSPVALDVMFQRVAQEIRQALVRLQSAPDRQRAEREGQELAQLTLQFGGIAALVQRLKPSAVDPSRAALAEKLKRQVASAEMIIQVLNQSPSDQNRERAYTLAGQVFGLQGTLRLAMAELDIYGFHDSDASFDSELSLLWWDASSYYLAGRTHNPMYSRSGPDMSGRREPPASPLQSAGRHEQLLSLPVLMVSRLDAPTAGLARQLVDKALLAERQGLEGKVYVDARGLSQRPPPALALFEQSLRELASIFRRTLSDGVVLEGREHSMRGSEDAAAVYVGSLPELQGEALMFSPGALGYHAGSPQSGTLHEPGPSAWYKQALAYGITVTIGSVGETLPESYPLPARLFGLLLTGRYSLVEAYYLTSPHLSWRMVLVGDPLYNPWRTASVQALSWEGTLPEPPSRLPSHDPTAALQELRHLRQITLAQIERVMAER